MEGGVERKRVNKKEADEKLDKYQVYLRWQGEMDWAEAEETTKITLRL